MKQLTERERQRLAEKLQELFRKEWGSEYQDSDDLNIYNYCMDEAQTDDVFHETMQYELKYG